MKKLIIITGISGIGKTTLAKYIQRELNHVTIITVDSLLENICDMIGFSNKEQKESIRKLTKKFCKKILEECMKREDEVIIIEYPFSQSWKNYFEKVSTQYQYDVLTLKLYRENFEECWEKVYERDLSPIRHIIHETDCYHPQENCLIDRNLQSKETLKFLYENEKRTDFVVGTELKIINQDNNTSLKRAIKQIRKWIEK